MIFLPNRNPLENNQQKTRYALGLQYLGTHFSGWQTQKNPQLRTVQSVLERAISKIANEPIKVICAGRTDAGVHALSQVVHFETAKIRADYAWLRGINAHLPDDCSVSWITAVSLDFHARFSAIGRHYRYYIYQSDYRSALLCATQTWIYGDLDIKMMQKAANLLVGTHDFSAFRSSECQAKSPIRTLHQLNIEKTEQGLVIYAHANAFLHHMVRNLVGVLVPIGQGKKDYAWALQVLESKTRGDAGITSAAQGLFLTQVDYPTALLDLTKIHNY